MRQCPICHISYSDSHFPGHLLKCIKAQKKRPKIDAQSSKKHLRKDRDSKGKSAGNTLAFIRSIKKSRERMLAEVQDFVIGQYRAGDKVIVEKMDSLAQRLDLPPLLKALQQNYPDDPEEKGDMVIKHTLQVEAMVVDGILPHHQQPLFQEVLGPHVSSRSVDEQALYNSFATSQYSLFEIIEVKKHPKTRQTTWCRLRDLFTNQVFDYIDPAIIAKFHIWDVVLGRLYSVRGYHLFSTATLITHTRNLFAFNRLLLYLWICWERETQNESLTDLIQNFSKEYLRPFEDFNNPNEDLASTHLYNPRLHEFLKHNCTSVREIAVLMKENKSSGAGVLVTPNGYPLEWVQAEGTIMQNNNPRIFEILKLKGDVFRQGAHPLIQTSIPDRFTFKILFNPFAICGESPWDFPRDPSNRFEELANLPLHEFLAQVRNFTREIIMANVSPYRLPVTHSLVENRIFSPAIMGFVDINENHIILTSFSQADMNKSLVIIRETLGDYVSPITITTRKTPGSDLSQNQAYPALDKVCAKNNISSSDMRQAVAQRIKDLNEPYVNESYNRDSRKVQRQSWFGTPHPLLKMKTPEECVDEPAMHVTLAKIIKQIENLEDYHGSYDPADSYRTSLSGFRMDSIET